MNGLLNGKRIVVTGCRAWVGLSFRESLRRAGRGGGDVRHPSGRAG